MTRGAAILLGLVAAASARKCHDLTIEVDLSARNGVFNLEAPASNIDVTNFILNLSRQGANYTDTLLSGYKTVSGKYELGATYCEPDHGPSDVVQILTHGVGFDRSYWDLPANNYNYSYAKVANDDYGYSTLAYDRLGLGDSSRGDPLCEIQSWLELSALSALTKQVRENKIPDLADKHFDKIVHVGHSFGSILSYSLTAVDPSASDGIVLTGFSQNSSFIAYFLLGGGFVKANSLPPLTAFPNGYLAPATESAVQTNFFSPGMFDPAILQQGFQNGQPVTVGELLTLGANSGSPNSFAGPALIITGDRDVPFCGGDCSATGDPEVKSLLDASSKMLQQASPFETYIVAGAGHGLALEYSHTETTGKINDFLTQNGLAGQ